MIINEPQISIVVPVYNNVKDLERCVRSVVCQTYTGWEAIFVDDGSNDGSEIILDDWARKDSRIKVVHQQNRGAANARNAGLERAVAPYITMVDADDELEENALELMYVSMQKSKADIIICGHKCVSLENKIILHMPRFRDGLQYASPKHIFTWFAPGPWAKLYRREIIEQYNVQFPDKVVIGEDYIFVANYWQYVKNVYAISNALYVYHDSSTSVTSRFAMGILPYKVYEETLKIHHYVYECVKNSKERVHESRTWYQALLRNHLIEMDWVILDVKHSQQNVTTLKRKAEIYYRDIARELSILSVIRINFMHKIMRILGKTARLGGKMKRNLLSRVNISRRCSKGFLA